MGRRVSSGSAPEIDDALADRNGRPDLRQVLLSNAKVLAPALVVASDPVVAVTDHSLGLVHRWILQRVGVVR